MRHPKPIIFNQKLGAVLPAINPSGSWLTSLVPFNYQRCYGNMDTWGCTNFSLVDTLQILGNFQDAIPDLSVSYNYVDSGTQPDEGNSYDAPVTSLENHWTCTSADRPFTPLQTTLADFIAPLTPDQESAAKNQWNQWEITEAQLPDTSQATIINALKTSPVRVGMDGDYDPNSLIQVPVDPVYDHVNVIVGIRSTDNAYILFDSEAETIEYAVSTYPFQVGFTYSLKKKVPIMMYKIQGQPAIGLYVPDIGGIVLFADGQDVNNVVVGGGSILKALGQTYSQAQEVEAWPYPLVGEITIIPKTN